MNACLQMIVSGSADEFFSDLKITTLAVNPSLLKEVEFLDVEQLHLFCEGFFSFFKSNQTLSM